MEWDDLRYVLAIARGGGLNGAARELDVNPSSVYRRLETLESQLEVRLFERLRSGYSLTPAGEALAESAKRMESEALAVERVVRGTDIKLEGNLRMSTSEAFAAHFLPQHLADFRALHPGITLDVGSTNQIIDLTRRDADVVIRAVAKAPEHLVGRECARIAFASYASREYLDRVGRGRPLTDYDWLGFDGELARVYQAKWLEQRIPESKIRLRFDRFAPLHAAVCAGIGCVALPCFTCDNNPLLERLPDTYQETQLKVWVLTHPDLRRSARVRAFLQFFGERIEASQSLMLGLTAGKSSAAIAPRKNIRTSKRSTQIA